MGIAKAGSSFIKFGNSVLVSASAANDDRQAAVWQ